MNALYRVILARMRVVVRFIILIVTDTISGYIELGMPALIMIVLIFSIIIRLIRLAVPF